MPYRRELGYIPPMPNQDSRHQTPASLMIDTHYAQLRLMERWTWDRYVRLCQFLRMTPWEVASLVMLRHGSIDTFRRKGRLSIQGHRAAALVLTILEAHVMREWTSDVIENVFPNLSGEPPPLPPRGPFPFHARKSQPSSDGCGGNGGSNHG